MRLGAAKELADGAAGVGRGRHGVALADDVPAGSQLGEFDLHSYRPPSIQGPCEARQLPDAQGPLRAHFCYLWGAKIRHGTTASAVVGARTVLLLHVAPAAVIRLRPLFT